MCFTFYIIHAGGGDTAVAAVTGKLEAEAERLAELVAVMEDREEQLVGEVSYLSTYLTTNYLTIYLSTQVRGEQEARRLAEARLEVMARRREVSDTAGERRKRVLLLTAAFGATNVVMKACTML